jgi:ATP-dependent RNA helicase SUPV3L1/SUV3
VLGPTNTGKTHYALERMAAHPTGMIGLPLRLLAREVYQRLVAKVGVNAVALVTGEEKIKPDRPRFWVSTVEAMPRDVTVDFVAVDEIQLSADLDRGHVFTDRLLNQRGRSETLLIGAGTMRPLVEKLLPGVNVVTRPRLSQLAFSGEKKLTRLPPRSAVVAFSAEEVYAVAELIRRQKGGAAVVMGSLSPRTRNAQVEMFQSGEVDYLVATDAIGMGLNLDVEHVAFASDRKFDGHRFRRLNPAEFGQIAGRAGRNMRDGLFGTTGRCPALEPELVEAIENHQFDPVRQLQWRNPDLDFGSLNRLKASLAVQPNESGLAKAGSADDEVALEIVSADPELRNLANGAEAVTRLWEACQVPDYRKLSPANHAELVGTLFRFLMEKGNVPAEWFKRQIGALDRIDGDIETLSNRIAQIRTWSFVANRPDWLPHPEHWQRVARQVEDKLSDALHERLAARFVDRRTSVLMRRLRENAMLEAIVTATGDVTVEGQPVGSLSGFHFIPDASATGPEAKALNAAAQKALAGELEARAARLSLSPDDAFVLANDGVLRWVGEPVAKLVPGDKILTPRLRLIADESLAPAAREPVEQRLDLWLKAHLTRHLGPLLVIEDAADLTGMARGIGFQIAEALGVLDRAKVANEVKGLDQEQRAALRKHGVRFGAYHLYLPLSLKPAPRSLASQLWALKHGGLDQPGRDDIAHLALSGRTSIPANKEVPRELYRSAGFHVAGERAIRVDILERLADLIRPAIAYRPGVTPGEPPAGAADGDGFVVTGAMTSLIGASGPDFANVLKALGYAASTRPGPAITVPLLAPARQEPVQVVAAQPQPDAGETASEGPAGEASVAEPGIQEVEAAVGTPIAAEAAPADDAIQADAPDDAPADGLAAAEAGDAGHEADAFPSGDGEQPQGMSADAADEAMAVPEPVLAEAAHPAPEIEVWRPQRRPQHEARRGARGAGRGAAGQDGERAGPRRGRGKGQEGARPSAQPGRIVYQRPEPAPGAAPSEGEVARPDRAGRNRPERKPFVEGEARSGEFRRDRGPRKGGGEGRPPSGDRGPRPDRKDGFGEGRRPERRDERPDRFRAEAPAPRADRQPDPDSPFAKLAALKAQLEGKS